MANSSDKLKLQENRFIYISELATETQSGVIAATNIHGAKAKLSMLKSNWEKFEADHEKLVSSKSDASPEHDYFKKKWYEEAMKAFVLSDAVLITCITELEATEPPDGSSLADVSFQRTSHHRPSLHGISIPKFFESFSEWRLF